MKGVLFKGGVQQIVEFKLVNGQYVDKEGKVYKKSYDKIKQGIIAYDGDNPIYATVPKRIKEFNIVKVEEEAKPSLNKTINFDWGKIIGEVLRHNGFSQVDLFEELKDQVKISKTYICELRNGKKNSPSFEIGLAILNLHPNKNDFLK